MNARAMAGLVAAVGVAVVAPATAGEAPSTVSAPMILNLMNRPLESPEAAFNKELKNYAAPTGKAEDPEVLPDGSVRYTTKSGRKITVTLRNPCPPGDVEHEMAQLAAERYMVGRGPRR